MIRSIERRKARGPTRGPFFIAMKEDNSEDRKAARKKASAKRKPRRSMPKRKKGEKTKALNRHASKRALQRYGISITKEDRKRLIELVRSNGTTIVEQQSGRVSIHEAEHEGQVVRFAYDKSRGAIITFLHRDPEKYQKEASGLAGMRRG